MPLGQVEALSAGSQPIVHTFSVLGPRVTVAAHSEPRAGQSVSVRQIRLHCPDAQTMPARHSALELQIPPSPVLPAVRHSRPVDVG